MHAPLSRASALARCHVVAGGWNVVSNVDLTGLEFAGQGQVADPLLGRAVDDESEARGDGKAALLAARALGRGQALYWHARSKTFV
jgi:hypothetical protein